MKIIILALAVISVFPANAQVNYSTVYMSPIYRTKEECETSLSEARANDSSNGKCIYKSINTGMLGHYYWTQNCISCEHDTEADCLSQGYASCAADPSTGCYYPTACDIQSYQSPGMMLQVRGSDIFYPACKECPKNATCDGKDVFCDSGYTLTVQESPYYFKDCVLSTEENNKIDNVKQTEAFASIEGECPDGLRKSSDGCCCIK